jgi:hypothetical protein
MLTFPARFLQLDNFLTDEEREALLAFVQGREADLVPSAVLPSGDRSQQDPAYRHSQVLFEIEEIRPLFPVMLETAPG